MEEAVGMNQRRYIRPIQPPRSAFAGFRFPPEAILIAVRWYLRYGLFYRDLEELLAERGIEIDHVTLFSGGSSGSHRCWWRRPSPAATASAVTGSWSKPT